MGVREKRGYTAGTKGSISGSRFLRAGKKSKSSKQLGVDHRKKGEKHKKWFTNQ